MPLRRRSRKKERELKNKIAKAQATWDALPAEEQWLHHLAGKCHRVHSIRRLDETPLEESALRALTSEVSEKFAKWILRKRKFRRILGLTKKT